MKLGLYARHIRDDRNILIIEDIDVKELVQRMLVEICDDHSFDHEFFIQPIERNAARLADALETIEAVAS